MKRAIRVGGRTLLAACGLLPICVTGVFAQTEADGDLIRQIQMDDSGLIWDYYLPTLEGVTPAPMAIPESGAKFELYAQGIEPDTKIYFLDSKIIGTYQPKAKVTITSEDPAVPLRTRADRPYRVKLRTAGMVNDDDADLHERMVFYRYVKEDYNPKTHAAPLGQKTNQVEVESFFMENGALIREQYTSLVGETVEKGKVIEDATKAEGEEVFTIFSIVKADTGSGFSYTASAILDSETIKVWPVAEGKIIGVEEDQKVLRNIPEVRYQVTDVYPDSLIYLHVYEGEEALGTVGKVIAASVRDIQADEPQELDVIAENWEQYLGDDGVYTMELLSKTPFNNGEPERLDVVTFTVDREIVVNANVGSSE
ncbi:hypothetical protein [Sulfuriroseicoccus oceanibius]|uniref:Uncharacterized protein n=1 Tax=Sulfuriroseicoccus oceanibius TaxID=2707525 RepID=A0A6B3LBH3_9BACT|nr:hypothetical protein [Sulfuriroseicoccus oceanibius]QQL44525.1 hypothetical protein G3M56_011630 [Sulfuriroseicoccus oceanibius]